MGPTRAELVERLAALGLGNNEIDAAAALDGPRRHRARVAATICAARRGANELLDREQLRDTALDCQRGVDLIAGTLLALDCAGIGGIAGVEGAGTARMPEFEKIGKGRKHASDGGAWMSAAREASHTLHVVLSLTAQGELVAALPDDSASWVVQFSDGPGELRLQFLRSAVCQTALRIAMHSIATGKSPVTMLCEQVLVTA